MFFILSKIVAFIADPLVFVTAFFILGLFVRTKYRRRRYLLISFVLLLFFSNGFIYQTVLNQWGVTPLKLKKKYDYGILLGGMISLNSTEEDIKFGESSDRLLYTVKLYQDSIINKIIITGASGSLQSEMIEAEYLKSYLLGIGIPETDIICETRSQNTFQNATYTAKLIFSNHKSAPSCLLITSDFHYRRALVCFKKNNLQVDPYLKKLKQKTISIEDYIQPQSAYLYKWQILLHEIIGYYTYKFMGYI
ncbi:YdcF family protein [Flavobacteriales bacterium]|nr:YdcF family protein [Flavobacteriales bacterium]